MLNAWMDARFLPAGGRRSKGFLAASVAAGLFFLALGLRGSWDHRGWTAMGILGGTMAAGWIVAWAAGARRKA